MSLLYKDNKDVVYDVQVNMESKDTVNILISADCGKFGADEIIVESVVHISSLIEFLESSEKNDD